MKNTIKWFGIIAFIAVIGFSFIACGGDDDDGGNDPFRGTWTNPNMKIIAANGSFKEYMPPNDKEVIRGTYTYSGNTVSATMVEVNTAVVGGSDAWVTYENLSESDKGMLGSKTQQLTISNSTFVANGMTFTKQQFAFYCFDKK